MYHVYYQFFSFSDDWVFEVFFVLLILPNTNFLLLSTFKGYKMQIQDLVFVMRFHSEVFDLENFVSEDIQVVFSHKGWEALGDFSAPDVHRQVSIFFSTTYVLLSHLN